MKYAWSAALIFVLAACGKQVEFPKAALLPYQQPKDHSKYKLTVEDVMEFWEGELAEYQLSAAVPDDTAVVSIEGLPDTASFSDSTLRIRWKPPMGAGKGSRPESRLATYPIRVHLRGGNDPLDILIRRVILVVYQKAAKP